MEVVSMREKPEYTERAIDFWHEIWGGGAKKPERRFYFRDTIERSFITQSGLPSYYMGLENGEIIGCVGLITSDFMACCDLWPWLCGLYVDDNHRGRGLGGLLMDRVKQDAKKLGFSHLYLCTDHTGYYEKYGFHYLFSTYDFLGESGRVYEFTQNAQGI